MRKLLWPMTLTLLFLLTCYLAGCAPNPTGSDPEAPTHDVADLLLPAGKVAVKTKRPGRVSAPVEPPPAPSPQPERPAPARRIKKRKRGLTVSGTAAGGR